MQPETQLEQQKWLQQLLGEWTFEGEASMGPGHPSMKSSGTESVRTIGGLWFLGEGQSEMPNSDHAGECTTGTMLITLGYDPKQGKFVGTWIGSMMNHMWIYSGALSDDKKTLMLEAEGECMEGDGKLALYRDSITFVDADHRALTSQVRDDTGHWTQFMEARYTRVK